MIADTSFLIDIMANDSSATRKARELEAKGVAVSIASPTVFELYAGAALSKKSSEEMLKITAVVGSLPQLGLDFQSAQEGGLIYAGKVKSGSRIDPEDAMFAGISRVKAEAVITRNVKHFSGIQGVTIEPY